MEVKKILRKLNRVEYLEQEIFFSVYHIDV